MKRKKSVQAIIKTAAETFRVESNSSISKIFMSTSATAQLDYYINLLIKNCNFDCLNSGASEREGVRERRLRECGLTKQWAKYILLMTLEIAVGRISWIPTRQECVWVCCVCACFCLQARASKITIISGANTHRHRQTLTKSDWKFRQDTERHRKLLPVVSKLEYTSGIVSKRVENSLLMSFNGCYICTC